MGRGERYPSAYFWGSENSITAALSPDGRTMLSDSATSVMTLWDVESGMPIRYFEGDSGMITSVAFSPDGRTALSGTWYGALILWDIERGTRLHTFVEFRDYDPKAQTR